MTLIDPLAFFDWTIAVPLAMLGFGFGAYVLWHFPTARIGARWVLFVLALADLLPWILIISFRGLEQITNYSDAYPRWYQSIGTMLMFLGFDLGAAVGIAVRTVIVARNARRRAVLPHGTSARHV